MLIQPPGALFSITTSQTCVLWLKITSEGKDVCITNILNKHVRNIMHITNSVYHHRPHNYLYTRYIIHIKGVNILH